MTYHKQRCNKDGSSSPIGLVDPDYIGQIYIDIASKKVYVANGLTNNDWQIVADVGGGGGGTRFRASLTEFQWIPTNAETQILFNTKDWDTNDEYDISTHTFTAKEEGYYIIMAQATLLTDDACEVGISIYKNDDAYFTRIIKAAEVSQLGSPNIANSMHLVVGDTLIVKFKHNAPTEKALIGTPAGSLTSFSINKL